jgi:hypothetical protein
MRTAAAVVVAGCALAAAAAAAAPAGDEPVPTRDCRSRGDPSSGGPPRFIRENDVVVGPLSFASLRVASARNAVYRHPDGTWFSKSAVKVLWGRPVTLSVPDPYRAQLQLEYSRGELTSSVQFEPCRPGTEMFGGGRLRRVTAFPGGFSFARPGCYPIEVRVERGRIYRRTISLGAGAC